MSKKDVRLPYFEVHRQLRTLEVGSWGVDHLKAREVSVPADGPGVVYFVIDTEHKYTHPAPIGVLEPRYDFNATEETTSLGHHGLHVGDTWYQVVRACPGAAGRVKLAFVKALYNDGGGFSSDIAQAINYVTDLALAAEHKGWRKVINLSLGADFPIQVVEAALKRAVDAGVFVVAAAGNDGKDVDYPGAWEALALTCGAIDQADEPAYFSSPGGAVNVAGPGVGIEAKWENGYAVLSGTSMATPHIGAVATILLLGKPHIKTQADLEYEIQYFATDVYMPGEDDKTGAGVPILPPYFEGQDPEPEPGEPGGVRWPWWAWVLLALLAIGGLLFALLKGMGRMDFSF